MKAVVTGGCGFIGSHVVDALIGAGHQVDVVDFCPPHRPDVGHNRLDIEDVDGLTAATRGADVVFHLAAVADVNDAAADPVGTIRVNVAGTAAVWEACRRNGVRRAVLASTVWVYGAAVGEPPLDEDDSFSLTEVGHIYTSSKLSAELVVHSYHALFGQEFTILRYGIPYGPRMRDSLVIPRFVRMACAGEPITVHGDGSQSRNYVYVGDLARAHVLALDEAAANRVLNLEGTTAISVRRLVECVGDVLELPVEVTFVEARAADYDGRAVSARAAELVGWRPEVGFEEGLRRYVEWYRHEGRLGVPVAAAARTPSPPPMLTRMRGALSRHGARVRSAVAAAPAALVLVAPLQARALAPIDRVAIGVMAVAGALAASATSGRELRYLNRTTAVVAAALVIWLCSQTTSGATLGALGALLGLAAGSVWSRDLVRSTAGRVGAIVGAGMLMAVAGGSPRALPWTAFALVVALLIPASEPCRAQGRASPGLARFARAAALVATAAMVPWVGATSAGAAWFGTVVTHGPRSGNEIAITFDGLADPAAIRAIIDTLDANAADATFFVSNSDVETRPDLVGEIATAGHLVGNNGTGRSGTDALFDASSRDIERTQRALLSKTGLCPTFFRPPQGVHTPLTAHAARRQNMTMVTWDAHPSPRPGDDPARLAGRVLASAKPGSIIDFNLGASGASPARLALTEAMLPRLVAGLKAAGLRPVRLDELLRKDGYGGICT